ncbi:MAG: DUF2378 family protein [Myxococcota bacterium]
MGSAIDAQAFPRTAHYLDLLPDGLDSYPEAQTKASVLRAAKAGYGLTVQPGQLPAPIIEVLDDPPPKNAWIPQVLNNAAQFAIADRYFPTDEAYLDWAYRNNVRLAQSSMYKVLTRVASPKAFLRGASMKWRIVHRGQSLEIDILDDDHARARISHPPHLHLEIGHRNFATAFEAILKAANAKDVSARVEQSSPTGADLDIRWAQ